MVPVSPVTTVPTYSPDTNVTIELSLLEVLSSFLISLLTMYQGIQLVQGLEQIGYTTADTSKDKSKDVVVYNCTTVSFFIVVVVSFFSNIILSFLSFLV